MLKLYALFFGVSSLMLLSHNNYPVDLHVGQRNRRTFFHRRCDAYMIIAIVWLTCFMFLRTDYNDTANYISSFHRAPAVSQFVAEGRLWALTGNPLFYFYQSLVRGITGNYHLFFLLPSVLISWSCVKIFKHYSNFPHLSMAIFLSLGTLITMMAAMKQGIAMAILLLSIPYVLDRKYVKFGLLVCLAALFHTYALIFLTLPLMCGKPWNLRTWLVLGITVFTMMTFDQTIGSFVDYAQSTGAHASEEDVFNNTSMNILRVAVYMVPMLISLIFRRRLFQDSRRRENLFVNMSILSALFMLLGTVNAANMMARMAAFFEIGAAISMPWMVKKLFNRNSADVLIIGVITLYFLFFLYEFIVAKPFSINYSSITLWEFLLSILP